MSGNPNLQAAAKHTLGEHCFNHLKNKYSDQNFKGFISQTAINQSQKLEVYGEKDPNISAMRKRYTGLDTPYYTMFHYLDHRQTFAKFQYSESNRENVFKSVSKKNGAIDGMFQYAKRARRDGASPYTIYGANALRSSRSIIYVAGTPSSALEGVNIGLYLITFIIDGSKARVLDMFSKGSWQNIVNEVSRNFADTMRWCGFQSRQSSYSKDNRTNYFNIPGNFMLLVLEDSGIDFVRYDNDWYHMVHGRNIVNTEAFNMYSVIGNARPEKNGPEYYRGLRPREGSKSYWSLRQYESWAIYGKIRDTFEKRDYVLKRD